MISNISSNYLLGEQKAVSLAENPLAEVFVLNSSLFVNGDACVRYASVSREWNAQVYKSFHVHAYGIVEMLPLEEEIYSFMLDRIFEKSSFVGSRKSCLIFSSYV